MFRLSANHWKQQDRLSHIPVVRTYREVFALPEFRVLFLVRCVTMAAISIGSLALGATTYASTGSPVLTALSMFGGPLITLLGSATVLSASDSMGLRRASTIMPIAYAVAFPLQERLVGATGPEIRGQAFGLYSTGLMLGQAIGAAVGGVLATRLEATHAIGTLAIASLCITVTLVPGLRRSAPATGSTGNVTGSGSRSTP
jgi:hypothetical protein